MNKYQHILGEIFNKPMMATPALMYDAVVFAKSRLGVSLLGYDSASAFSYGNPGSDPDDDDTEYTNGIANISVYGPLVPRTGNLDMCSRMTAYESISAQFLSALNDPECKAIIMDIDSPGGSVTGCFELANLIYQSRGIKPIQAIVNFNAYSAAYMIASACDSISLSETGGVGSIGVIMQHTDYSKMLDEEGIKITTLYRGDNKANGNPAEPLSDAALAEFNKSLDSYYQMFVGFVSKAKNIPVEAVIATQAGCFYGAEAISAGLADTLQTAQQAIQSVYDAIPQKSLIPSQNQFNQKRMKMQIDLAKIHS